MKLQELLDKQKELNEAIGSYPETPDQLAMALAEECGEVARELRANWRWWSWAGQTHEMDREKLVGEINDVLKFSLVGLLRFSESDELETAHRYWEADWEQLGSDPTSVEMAEIITAFTDESGWQAIAGIARICASLSISREELEAAYITKWKKNMQRVNTGKD